MTNTDVASSTDSTTPTVGLIRASTSAAGASTVMRACTAQPAVRTRLPQAAPGDDWDYGVPNHNLAETVAHWRTAFDWRAQEERINAYPHHLTEIDGQTIHFLHIPSSDPDATPLLLAHSYPARSSTSST